MKKYFFIGLFILILATIGGYFIRVKSAHESAFIKPQKNMIPIHIVQNSSFTDVQNFVGSVQAIQSVAVVPYLSAFLKEVRVKAGEEVNEGQTLFLLDERIPLANLEQAKEETQEAYATRANALIYYERMKNTEQKAISSTELEQAKTEFEAADAAYQKALAAQNQAQTIYDYTIISAPITGWVGNITATVGEYLSPEGKSLATIIGFSPIRLIFSVPMTHYNKHLSFDNARLQITLADGQQQEFTNFKVIQDNKANQSTDSVSFFIDVENPKKHLMPGAYIEIKFLQTKKGILLDKNWVSLTPNGANVFVLENGIIEKRIVEIGSPIGNQYWIKSGLLEGDKVITIPVSFYQIGQSAQGVPQ